jgi:lipopolysaccharide transport system permease protein
MRRRAPGSLRLCSGPLRVGLPEEPLIVIQPEQRWMPLDLREVWTHRELLFFLTWRDVTVRYKQTFLGGAWAVLQPLLTTVIFVAFFGKLVGAAGPVPYVLFAYAGLLLWTFFANAVNAAASSLIGSAHLITKVYFPRIFLPAAAVAAALVDLLVASVMLVVLCFYERVTPTPRLLLVVLIVGLMVVLAFSAGLWMAALNVRYRDVRHALPFVVQMLLFVSAVIYPSSMVPAALRPFLLLNPIATFIEAFRACLFGTPLDWGALGIGAALTLLLLLCAAYSFNRLESTFGDVI